MPGAAATHRAARRRTARFLLLLAGSGLVFCWNLGVNGWGNSFYAAAVQAGVSNWKAFLFGSSDMANSITVDKPPASLWVMELAARVFGFHPLVLLAPEALMGVATVALLYRVVLPRAGEAAALLSGVLLVLTPVAVLMFRYNNPDALLALLLTAAAAATLAAIDTGRTMWLVLAGVAIGFGFLTKQLQAFLILPALITAYLAFAKVNVLRRVLDLFAALAAMVISAGWWVALVQLIPPGDRPYIGGSQTNDFLELTFGYNGVGRLTGGEVGSVTSATDGNAPNWGSTGLLRLFDAGNAEQITWLIWPMLGLVIAALVIRRDAQRNDRSRQLLLVFGLWFLVTFVVFDYMGGIFHAYYAVALAPPLAGLVGVSAPILFRARRIPWVRLVLVASILDAGIWACAVVGMTSASWSLGLTIVVAVLWLGAGISTWAAASPGRHRAASRVAIATVLAAVTVGPAPFILHTVEIARVGAEPMAGPTYAAPGVGLLAGPRVEPALAEYLREGGAGRDWAAAVVGSENAAAYQLATGRAVMPLGGFNGSDPAPTLAQFKADVARGDVRYYIVAHTMTANGGSAESALIDAWVKTHFHGSRIDKATIYDLS
jgi:4-amino-4-deoxy-L-arabinose transferase-like glycosyltransferase